MEKGGNAQAACAVLGVSKSTLYARARYKGREANAVRRRSGRALTPEERETIVAVLNSERFVDFTPYVVWAKLADEGRYLCSPSTMYRILRARNEVRERRKQARRRRYAKPELLALGPNQVWSWDISAVKGPVKGLVYYLYVIIDIFSRYIVGWRLEKKEKGHLASTLISETCWRQNISDYQLQLHSDRGSSMKSKPVADLQKMLGMTLSFSRPRVSNDNPFSESQFKTMKMHHSYPDRFPSFEDAVLYFQELINSYNNEHYHSSLGMLTPSDVHYGRVEEVLKIRQAGLDAAYDRHPERFVNGKPVAARPPEAVWINKPDPEKAEQVLAQAKQFWRETGQMPDADIRSVLILGDALGAVSR